LALVFGKKNLGPIMTRFKFKVALKESWLTNLGSQTFAHILTMFNKSSILHVEIGCGNRPIIEIKSTKIASLDL